MAQGKEPLGVVWPVWRVSMGLRGLKGFKWFEGCEGFEAFGGSVRHFRASRKRKTWLATAASFAAEKEPLGLPQLQIWQLQEPVWHVWRGLRGLQGLDFRWSMRQLRASRDRKTWPATAASLAAAVWQKKRNHLGLASNGLKGLKGLKRLEGASGSFGPVEKERLGLPQPRVVHQKRNHLACHSLKFGSSKSRFGMFGGV